jgi:uncharacterized protein YcbX
MALGRVAKLFRHPVESMAGEVIARAELGPNGVPGDRAWAVRDETRGGIRGAKKIPALMRCRARYVEEPAPGRPAPAPEITPPDGATLRAGSAVLRVTTPCPRCVMITHAFDDLPRDPGLMRTVVREASQCVGVYAAVEEPGEVRAGDEIALLA